VRIFLEGIAGGSYTVNALTMVGTTTYITKSITENRAGPDAGFIINGIVLDQNESLIVDIIGQPADTSVDITTQVWQENVVNINGVNRMTLGASEVVSATASSITVADASLKVNINDEIMIVTGARRGLKLRVTSLLVVAPPGYLTIGVDPSISGSLPTAGSIVVVTPFFLAVNVTAVNNSTAVATSIQNLIDNLDIPVSTIQGDILAAQNNIMGCCTKVINGEVINAYRGATFEVALEFTTIDLSLYENIIFSVKGSSDVEDDAILRVSLLNGLERIQGNAPTSASNGVLEVLAPATGNFVRVDILPIETQVWEPVKGVNWQVKGIDTDTGDAHILMSGEAKFFIWRDIPTQVS
jgi:hypothetical protein